MENTFDQAVDSDIKRCEDIRKLTTWQGSKDYTTGCLLHYGCIKKNYRLVAID